MCKNEKQWQTDTGIMGNLNTNSYFDHSEYVDVCFL